MLSESEIKSSLGDWGNTDFTIGDTRFRVSKLSPLEAFGTMEKIRVAAAPVLASYQDESVGDFSEIISEVLKIDPASLSVIRDELFAGVRFTNGIAKTERILQGNIDMAFSKLLPIHIYEVLGRALVINFLESFCDILRRGAAET